MKPFADGVSTRLLGVMDAQARCGLWLHRSPEMEHDNYQAVGVSTRAISVMVGGLMSSRRKELGIPVTTWKGEGGLLHGLGDSRNDLCA